MRAPALDVVSAIMDAPERPLDGAAVVRLRAPIPLEALERGAAGARIRYPKSAAILDGSSWRPTERSPPIVPLTAATATARTEAISAFIAARIDLRRQSGIRQALLSSPEGVELITHCHHAATDLSGGVVWVQHQLAVAAGREPGAGGAELALWTHDNPRRKSRHAHRGPSTRLFRRRGRPSSARRLSTIELDAQALRAAIARHQGYTLNDVLIAVTLEVYARWNAHHGAPTRRLALWCPINIRTDPFVGFGNGSSRIRIYADPLEGNLQSRARGVRVQVRAAKADGEWFVPPVDRLLSLPPALLRFILRAYLRRPWVDMASGVLSHGERLGPGDDPLPGVDRAVLIGPLDRSYPVGLVAAGLGDRTTLSIVRDPALWTDEDGATFQALLEEALHEARRALER